MDAFKSLYSIAFFSFFLFTTFSIAPTTTISDWKLTKSKNGIQVFTRSVAGYQLKEYKCEMKSKQPIDLLVKLLKDYNNHKNWGAGISESTILSENNLDDFYVYFRNPAPWPFSDRDIVNHFQWENWEDGTINIKMEATPDQIPYKDGVVRIIYFKGYWRLIPNTDGSVSIISTGHADPGGKIPDWLANFGVVDIPYDTMAGLRKYAERS